MRLVLSFLTVFIISLSSFAQQSTIDSLLNEIEIATHDTTKIILLLDIGDRYEYSIPDSAIYYYSKALNIALNGIKSTEERSQKSDYKYWAGKAYSFYGLVMKNQGNPNKALEIFNKSLKFYNELSKSGDTIVSENGLIGKTHILDYIGMTYDDLSEYEKAISCFYEVIELKKKYDEPKGVGATYNNIANIYRQMGEYEKAIEIYNDAMEILKLVDSKTGMARINNNMAMVFRNTGDHVKAIELYNENLRLYDELCRLKDDPDADRNKLYYAYTLSNIGVVNYNMKNYEKALEYYNKADVIFQEFGDKRSIAFIYNNNGNVYLDMGNYDKAEHFFTESLLLKEEIDDIKGMASSYNNLGLLCEMKGEFEQALLYYQQSLDIKEKINNIPGIANTLRNMSALFNRTKQYSKAITYGERGLVICREINQVEDEMYVLDALSKAYKQQGNTVKALGMYEAYIVLKDSFYLEDKNRQILEIETKYETEKKDQEINLLKKNDEIKSLKISEQNLLLKSRTQQLIILVIAIVLLIIVSAFIYYNYRQKQKRLLQDKLLEEKKLRMKAIIETEENERGRIAKDLHDGIGQVLSATMMNISQLTEAVSKRIPEKKAQFEKSINLLNEASTELRSISHQMMPRALKESGLVVALKDLLFKTFDGTEIKYRFETGGIEERLNEHLEVGLYRICQELTGNIIKHSQANEVSVHLHKSSKHIVLIIEDNGRGIPLQIKADGVGLKNISSRTETLNGNFQIEKGPIEGTSASIRIPLA